MDTDDIAKPDRFEKQIKIFEKYPDIDICSAWIEEFENDTNNILSIKNYQNSIRRFQNTQDIDVP